MMPAHHTCSLLVIRFEENRVDIAYGLTALTAAKLVVYTFGSLVHFFLVVLILGNWRVQRFQILLFGLMLALFMWYSGNLLALNLSLYYGASPALLSGFAGTISIVGFLAAVPLLVHAQADYCSAFLPMRKWQRLLVACFYLPVISLLWIIARLLRHPGLEPLVALGRPVRLLVLWAVAALVCATVANVYLYLRRSAHPPLARLHGYLAALQGLLALGWSIAYLPYSVPPIGGLGGYFATGLLFAGILPSALVGYSIFRHNFLDLRVQRNVFYSVAAIFGFLIYLNFMRRLSGWLEVHDVLPAAVTEGVMIFVLVVLVEPLKRLISRALHRQFVSEFEKVQDLAAEIENLAKTTGDVNSLRAWVEEHVAGELGLDGVRLHTASARSDAVVDEAAPLTQRVPISRRGETVGFLEVKSATGEISGEQTAALEILADRLAGALELCRLIAEKVGLERELAAKEKMAFLGEMAARIAHNVKNPLSGMKTIVQLMEEDKTLPENTRRDCQMLVAEIDRLNRNISQVLRFAKPARDIDRPVDLASVVRRVAGLSRPEAGQRHVSLETSDSGTCLIEGGEEAASDIVSNLLVNALEASGENSTIRIRLARLPSPPEQIELSMEDEGRGIPVDKLDRIFQPFFTTRPGGTGLGLAIVKRRVDEIGGSIECQSPVTAGDSTSAHPGSRFVVRFLAARPRGLEP